jgi:NMT1/THI5 like
MIRGCLLCNASPFATCAFAMSRDNPHSVFGIMEREALTLDNLAAAMAAKNSRGFVIAQVERIAAADSLNPRDVQVPGILVDCVVLAEPMNHVQTYGTPYNHAFSGRQRVPLDRIEPMDLDERKIIARRCAFELPLGGVVNLGIGMPERFAQAQQVERPSLELGVANKAHLYYLPLTLAERRGHFKDYGLTIATSDFEGGGQSLEALLAGSVDVVTGAYEHTLLTQARGQDIRAVIELGRFPGVVLAVGSDRPFKSHADLKGMKIGVTAPSSSSHFFVLYLMAKAGLAPADAKFVGVHRCNLQSRSGDHPFAAGRRHPHHHGQPLSAR